MDDVDVAEGSTQPPPMRFENGKWPDDRVD